MIKKVFTLDLLLSLTQILLRVVSKGNSGWIKHVESYMQSVYKCLNVSTSWHFVKWRTDRTLEHIGTLKVSHKTN